MLFIKLLVLLFPYFGIFVFSLKDSIQIRTDEGKKLKIRAPGIF